jgi:hypothetical protein
MWCPVYFKESAQLQRGTGKYKFLEENEIVTPTDNSKTFGWKDININKIPVHI